jgi:mevalonate kinase
MSRTSLQARSPAKLILSGEHAVLYGTPAIAIAVNRYAESRISPHLLPKIVFNLLNLKYAKSFTRHTLSILKQRLHEQYHTFLEGQCSIREVLKMPFELLQYTVINLLEKFEISLAHGVEIRSSSNIPMGCGMGSSAATVMSTLFALSHFFNLDIDPIRFLTLGREAENLQHGRSSGLDLQLVLQGGCLKFQNGIIEPRALPGFPISMIYTGIPETTTGQCVSLVAPYFENQTLSENFTAVTHALDEALAKNDIAAIQQAIRENHRLLVNIGVVPEKVQSFIQAIEKRGGAAKICGAGAVKGEQGGVMWIMINQDITTLIQQYGYTLHTVEGDNLGTRII